VGGSATDAFFILGIHISALEDQKERKKENERIIITILIYPSP